MPFPRSEYCIVCEGVRPELGGKLTIFGFYGLSPNVEVVLTTTASINLCFVIGFGPAAVEDAAKQHQGAFSILGPGGNQLMRQDGLSQPESGGSRLVLVINAVFVPDRGIHLLRYDFGQGSQADFSFNVRNATQDEIRTLGPLSSLK